MYMIPHSRLIPSKLRQRLLNTHLLRLDQPCPNRPSYGIHDCGVRVAAEGGIAAQQDVEQHLDTACMLMLSISVGSCSTSTQQPVATCIKNANRHTMTTSVHAAHKDETGCSLGTPQLQRSIEWSYLHSSTCHSRNASRALSAGSQIV